MAVTSQLVDFVHEIWIQQPQSKMVRQKTTQTCVEAEKKSKGEASRKTPMHQKATPPTAGAQKHKRM